MDRFNTSDMVSKMKNRFNARGSLFKVRLIAGLGVWTLVMACLGLNLARGQVDHPFYRTDLPAVSPDGKFRKITARPLVSKEFQGAIPTHDFWSSLVWPTSSPHSLPMFPHPLAVQAFEDGLGMGYSDKPVISHSFHENKMFQKGTSYKYPYREGLRVGLVDFLSPNTVLLDSTDWSVTALWKSEQEQLQATIAHGSPYVFFESRSEKPFFIRFQSTPVNQTDEPIEPLTYRIGNLTGKHTGQDAIFELAVNAGKNIGVGSKVRFLYDFDGDKITDRIETFGLFASDPDPGSFEKYSSGKQQLDNRLTYGEKKDFENGSIHVEFWKCFGPGNLEVDHRSCFLDLPNGKRYYPTRGQSLAASPEKSSGKILDGDTKGKPASVFFRNENALGVTVNGVHYGIFAPSSAVWSSEAEALDEIQIETKGKNFLSVAILPNSKLETIKLFEKYAYAFLVDSQVNYRFDPVRSVVVTEFSAKTTAKQGSNHETLFAVYPHQYLNMPDQNTWISAEYASPRGPMKLLAGSSFRTVTPFLGVLPTLPVANQSKVAIGLELKAFHKAMMARKGSYFESQDTYWNGKEFGKLVELIQIAEQLGKTTIRNDFLKILKDRLADWADKQEKFFFYYDQTWNTLVGYPDSYGSADQMNDHHFHYSYFIRAAATIAQFDADWVSAEKYRGFIDILIRDCANDDRRDNRFPWMRNFDPYAGHSWAAGHSGFASGNNQESSSESMNFASSLILYGEAIHDKRIRDLGIYWHATEAEAIRHYWFDMEKKVFPKGYAQSCVGMIWGDGGSYGTWWTANPEEIHGINFLPMTGGSLYLGRDPQYIQRNFQNMLKANRDFHQGGFPGEPDRLDRWQDILHQYLAMSDPKEAAVRRAKNGKGLPSEFGETAAHTEHWISSLAALGHFNATIQGDYPISAVFQKEGKRVYVIYNLQPQTLTVRFSDGEIFEVPPGLNQFSK